MFPRFSLQDPEREQRPRQARAPSAIKTRQNLQNVRRPLPSASCTTLGQSGAPSSQIYADQHYFCILILSCVPSVLRFPVNCRSLTADPTAMAAPPPQSHDGTGRDASNHTSISPNTANAMPGDASKADGTAVPARPGVVDPMRAYRACLNCRGRKSRCDLDINNGRPVRQQDINIALSWI
jgi:hypothetical protein